MAHSVSPVSTELVRSHSLTIRLPENSPLPHKKHTRRQGVLIGHGADVLMMWTRIYGGNGGRISFYESASPLEEVSSWEPSMFWRGHTPASLLLSPVQTLPQASPIPSNPSSPTSPSAPACPSVRLLRRGDREPEQELFECVAQLVVVVPPPPQHRSSSGASVAPKVERQAQRQG